MFLFSINLVADRIKKKSFFWGGGGGGGKDQHWQALSLTSDLPFSWIVLKKKEASTYSRLHILR